MKNNIKSVLVLVCICLAVSLMLALTNHITKDKIAQNNSQAAFAACYEVMPDAKSFEEVDLSTFTGLPASLTNAYVETSGLGYTYKMVVTGKNPGLTIMVGIDKTGKITKAMVVSSQETPSYFGGDKASSYADNFSGKDSTLQGITTISGATVSTQAFIGAVNDAFVANGIIAGMEVVKSKEALIAEVLKDTMTVSEITVEGTTFENVAAIYNSDQYDGYAVEVIINDINYYICFSYAGNVLGLSASKLDELSDGFTLDKTPSNEVETTLVNVVNEISLNKSVIANSLYSEAFNKVLGVESASIEAVVLDKELPTLDKTFSYVPDYEYDEVEKTVSASVTSVFETEAGYIYFVKAKGHNGAIVLLVSIDKEGKLIDTYTVYQKESSPYTDRVWKDQYLDQYHGITSVPEEGFIQSMATVTSNAYKLAVKCAFEAHKLVEGGNN